MRAIKTTKPPIGVLVDYETEKKREAALGFCSVISVPFKRERFICVIYIISILHIIT